VPALPDGGFVGRERLPVLRHGAVRGPAAERLAKLGEGTHAIAFRCSDLERDIARARSVGLELLRRGACGPGAQEAEFAPEAGVIVKLVQRA